MFPKFFVVGAQKCGTTSLHSYLNAHPAIYLPEGKETKFFVDDERYAKGLEYYKQHWFSGATRGQLVGEVDPEYIYFRVALERIAAATDIKQTKFLFLLREPVDRAFSHYLMSYGRGFDPLSFEKAIAAEPNRLPTGYFSRLHHSYVDRGFYYTQILRFLELVGIEQMLFIFSEDLSQNTEQVMAEIFGFLDLDYIDRPEYRERHREARVPRSLGLVQAINSEGWHKKIIRALLPVTSMRKGVRQAMLNWNQSSNVAITMRQETRRALKSVYREENEKLSKLIGRDLAHWS